MFGSRNCVVRWAHFDNVMAQNDTLVEHSTHWLRWWWRYLHKHKWYGLPIWFRCHMMLDGDKKLKWENEKKKMILMTGRKPYTCRDQNTKN